MWYGVDADVDISTLVHGELDAQGVSPASQVSTAFRHISTYGKLMGSQDDCAWKQKTYIASKKEVVLAICTRL